MIICTKITCISSKACVIIFSGSSKLFSTLFRFAFATLWNRSNKFIDSDDDLHDGDDVRWSGSVGLPVKEDDVEKAWEDTSDETRRSVEWKFIIIECLWLIDRLWLFRYRPYHGLRVWCVVRSIEVEVLCVLARAWLEIREKKISTASYGGTR